jgi:hypothetical protein
MLQQCAGARVVGHVAALETLAAELVAEGVAVRLDDADADVRVLEQDAGDMDDLVAADRLSPPARTGGREVESHRSTLVFRGDERRVDRVQELQLARGPSACTGSRCRAASTRRCTDHTENGETSGFGRRSRPSCEAAG